MLAKLSQRPEWPGNVEGGSDMHRRVLAIIMGFAMLWPGLALAAIIGPTNDWMPLRTGARQLGISSRMVQRILDAGVAMSCPGTVHSNGGTLNGWFLGDDASSFYTNAHGIIDIGADRRSNFIEPLDKCQVHSYRDLVASGIKAAAYDLDLPKNRNQLALATFQPQGDSPGQDRARLRLLRSIAGAKALPLPDFNRIKLAVGQQVIMVSVQPPAMRSPEIQACRIQSINLSRAGPGQLFTDCDNSFGNSAGLYFVRDPADPTNLLPIALHEGCHEKLGDHRGWNLEDNTALAIMLRSSFFSFPRRAS
jgi:hypothetical protein